MKNAFIDPQDVLTAFGFMQSNNSDTPIPVADDFEKTPGEWQLIGGSWLPYSAPSQPAVPHQVTMRQARLALLGAGKLAAVSGAIAALPSPQKEAAQIEWEYSAFVERNSSVVALLGVSLDLDAGALDTLFIEASQL